VGLLDGWSGWLPVAGYLGDVELCGLLGDVNPSGVAVTGEVDADERAEGMLVDAVVAVADDCAVDVPGDDQGQRAGGGAECFLDGGGVEQAEGDV